MFLHRADSIAMLVKKLSSRKEAKDGKLQLVTTMVFSISITLLVLVLGMIVHDHFRKFVIYEDLYFSSLNAFPPLYPFLVSSQRPCVQERNSSSLGHELRGFISPKAVEHSMNDEELLWQASMVPRIIGYPFVRKPKVAFMFLSRGRLFFSPLWELFFKGHEGFFSIYVHTSPGFRHEQPRSSVFYKRQIPSKPVQWGKASMIDAQRGLLANALLDFSNERFVLLSETCIPIVNFTTIYNYLVNSNQSFLSTFYDPKPLGRGRYNKLMGPATKLSDWRKGSHWFEANRELALAIVSDVTYYPIFKNHCKPPCYMDEHYLPTLVTKVCPSLTSNRTITWTDWSRARSHPTMFRRNNVTEAFLETIRNGFKCSYNGHMSSICFLFARKFHPNTLQPLLRIAPRLFGFNR